MRVKQKQINYLLLLFLFFSIFMIVPNIVFANEELEKGKLQIRTERIMENDSNGNQELIETELEKTLPELFQDEMKEKINLKQEEEKITVEQIKEQIFHEELPSSTAIYEVRSELFTEDYTPPRTVVQEDEDEEETQSSSTVVYGTIATFVGIMLGGVFLVTRNWGGS